jgi:long-chain acyl-CoA synthetase
VNESRASYWPARSLSDIQAELCAPGAPFEMETVDIRGVPTRTWKNALPNVRALVDLAHGHGDRLATIYQDERVSYAAQHRAIVALANALLARGVRKGDRVAIAMANLPEWPVAFFAVTAIGAIAVPLNAWWTGGELTYALQDSGAAVLITDLPRWSRLAALEKPIPPLDMIVTRAGDRPPAGATALESLIGSPAAWAALPETVLPDVCIAPDDDVTIFYTSGTTGFPKGAVGTHRNLMSNIMAAAYVGTRTFLRRGDPPPSPTATIGLIVIPLFHVTACSAGLVIAMAAGNTTVYMPKWDVVAAMAIIERERVQVTGGVPTIAWQLLEHPDRPRFDLSSLLSIGYGGAPAAPELVRRIHDEFGAMPATGWGMTETMATVTSHSGEEYLARPDSCGPPVPVSDIRIVADDGVTAMAQGEVGELWARGPQIVRGYWNNPEATAATFIGGWVRTGDLARVDEEGFCYIVDRAKDMIIRGGENIYSSEVENVLYAHPAVTDAAVVPVPHRILGEEPAAVVHLAPGMSASEQELQAWVRERLAAYKTPVRIVFSETTLPRNANGKILKAELKRLVAA